MRPALVLNQHQDCRLGCPVARWLWRPKSIGRPEGIENGRLAAGARLPRSVPGQKAASRSCLRRSASPLKRTCHIYEYTPWQDTSSLLIQWLWFGKSALRIRRQNEADLRTATLKWFPFEWMQDGWHGLFFVIAGLDPAIHLLCKGCFCEADGPAGQARG